MRSEFKKLKKASFLNSHVIDITGRSRPYDLHLAAELCKVVPSVRIWIGGNTLFDEETHRSVKSPLFNAASRIPHRYHHARKVLKAIEYIFNLIFLYLYIWRVGADIVHFQWLPLLEIAPRWVLRHLQWIQRRGVQVVYTAHNVLPHDTGELHVEAYSRMYECIDGLICHTKQSKKRLVQDLGVQPSKIWVIPHGPLSDEVSHVPQHRARKSLDLGPKEQICLLFGHMRPYKGVDFLLSAWRNVLKKEPLARLILAGKPKGEYGDLIKAKVNAMELENSVDMHLRFLSQEELNLFINASDILVYPYRHITQSGALLTGLTTGKPIVATDVGGFSEMIQHNQTGVLVEYGDEEQLAEELVQLLRDKEKRDQLGRTAIEMVETNYSWEVIARRTVECYQSIVN